MFGSKKDQDSIPIGHQIAKSVLTSLVAWGATVLTEKLYDTYVVKQKKTVTQTVVGLGSPYEGKEELNA